MTAHDDCVFCDIVAGRAPSFQVYADDATVAFLDRYAAAKGHTLVVPRTHYTGLTDADAPAVSAVFETVHRVAVALESALEADGVSVFQSTGAAAGQDVFHLHVHVVPRWEDDDIRLAPARERVDEETGRELAADIADHL